MQKLPPIFQKDFSTGQISDINVNLAPQSSCNLILNMDSDYEIGSLVSRLGTARIGSQLVSGKSILGIIQHVDQGDTTKNKLFAAINASGDGSSVIYDVSAGTTSLTGDTASKKAYFLNYNGDTLRLNGTDNPKAYNSTTWITTGGVFDLANMPTGYKYAAEFLSRVYLWGKDASPYTLAYSGLLTAGAVSWTSGNGTVEIEPEDNGGEATGLAKVPGYILLFKRRSLHRFNYASAFPEALINIGAYSQESIISAAGLCAFYSDSNENSKGFYITDGRRPIPISHDSTRPIKKWVDAISSSATVAGFGTDRYFAWSVGDLTIDGETYTNVVLKYNHILKQWSVRSYPSEFKVFASYVASGVYSIVGGNDNGTVHQIDKLATYTDSPDTGSTATPIPFKLRTHHNTWGFNQIKEISNDCIVRGKNITNTILTAILNEDLDDRVPLNSPRWWRKIISIFKTPLIRATSIAIEVAGESVGARSYIREIEYPTVTVTDSFT